MTTTIGRNDACPCGSGRKYKKCCLGTHEAAERAARQREQQEAGEHEHEHGPNCNHDHGHHRH